MLGIGIHFLLKPSWLPKNRATLSKAWPAHDKCDPAPGGINEYHHKGLGQEDSFSVHCIFGIETSKRPTKNLPPKLGAGALLPTAYMP